MVPPLPQAAIAGDVQRCSALLPCTPLLAALLAAASLLAACSTPSAERPCPRRGATFRVQVTAGGGELPRDTAVEVAYGSDTERFDLRHQNADNEDVCCRALAAATNELGTVACATAQDAGVVLDPLAVQCELSTNGAARVTVTATGYRVLEQTLEAQRREDEELQHCDALVTRDVFLELERGDAGL